MMPRHGHHPHAEKLLYTAVLLLRVCTCSLRVNHLIAPVSIGPNVMSYQAGGAH